MMDTKTPTTLFALPFAGGNSFSYRPLEAHLSDSIKLTSLELPGHGKRMRQPLLSDMQWLVKDILTQLQTYYVLNQPYAFFGHSMGAVLALLVTRHLQTAQKPLPKHLFISGYRPPSLPSHLPLRYNLPKVEFQKMLRALGGSPSAVLENEDLMEMLEPILRQDFQAIETYVYQPHPPLNVPMTVCYGTNDKNTKVDMSLWQQETQQPVNFKVFEGGHFFIFDHLPVLGKLITDTLQLNESDVQLNN